MSETNARSTVHLIEAGKTTPRLSVMRRISEALEVPPSEIDEFRQAIGETENSNLARRLKDGIGH